MHLSTCSEIDLDADILTWSGQGWTEGGRAQRGKLRVLLGKVRESSMGKGALELGFRRMVGVPWLWFQSVERR